MIFLVAVFLELHGPNGQMIKVNVDQITSLRSPQISAGDHFAKGVHCLLKMTNGHTNGVTETCDVVLQMIKENHDAK
jgi:hypothetical protein